jgi:hypothetical protein
MALFSWSMQIIKRSAGRSVVAAAAYRAGERLHDERKTLPTITATGVGSNIANCSFLKMLLTGRRA